MALRVPSNMVSSNALPGARQQSNASAADFGGLAADQLTQSGRAMQGAGEDLHRAGVLMQERENADRIFSAETALKNKQLEFDRTLEERKGQNAWGVTKDAETFWETEARTIGETLTNERQRALFAQTVERLKVGHLDGVARYESGQRRESVAQSTEASIVGSINIAAANAGSWKEQPADGEEPSLDPISVAKQDIVRRTEVLARLNGWAPERATMELDKNLTQLHKQVLQSLVDTDPKKAKAYYTLNKEEISGSERDGIEKVLNEGVVRITAQEVGDKVMADGMDETAALAYVRENFEGDEETAAVTEIKTRFAETKVALANQEKENSNTAWGVIAQGGGRRQIPPDVWAALDAKEKIQINEHLRVRADRAKAEAEGKTIKTDVAAYYDLQKFAVNDPQAFAATNLMTRPEFNKLSQSDQIAMIKLQKEAAKGGDDFAEIQTVASQISATTAQLGIDDKTELAIAEGKIKAAIDAEARDKGRKLDAAERQKVIDRMFVEGEVGTGIFAPDRRLYEVYGSEDAAKFVPKIPANERAKIVEAIKRAGGRPTDAEIARLYKMKLGL